MFSLSEVGYITNLFSPNSKSPSLILEDTALPALLTQYISANIRSSFLSIEIALVLINELSIGSKMLTTGGVTSK